VSKVDEIAHEDAVDKLLRVRTSRQPYEVMLLKRDPPERGKEHRFHQIAEYPAAHGTSDHPTPKGYFVVMRKAKDPDWRPPDSDWVGPELRDENGVPKVIPGGDPANPIRGAFLDLGNGIGIHGTLKLESLGSRASHGCVRVSEDDAYELYRRVPVGSVVHIY
jgi:lipoprotein-anchoring transpeptidase ErfK/SrfK